MLAVPAGKGFCITGRGRKGTAGPPRAVVRAEIATVGVGRIATNKLWFKVVNVGRRSIWLTQIGGGVKNGKNFLITVPKQFPIKLEPGETFDDASSDAEYLKPHVDGTSAWRSSGCCRKRPSPDI